MSEIRQARPAREHGASRLDLIGLDVSGRRSSSRARISWPAVIVVLLLALGLATLRVDLTRMRYALGDALATEQRLLEEQRGLTVELRTLRDPSGLAVRARELGFVHPERVIDLPMGVPSHRSDDMPGSAPSETALAFESVRP